MIIQLKQNISDSTFESLNKELEKKGLTYSHIKTNNNDYLVCDIKKPIDIREIGHLKGVKDVHKVNDKHKLVSKSWKLEQDGFDYGNNFSSKKGSPLIIAGPCAVESENQLNLISEHLENNNIQFMRGGVFKPRSSPYTFRGLGMEGIKMMFDICQSRNQKVVTEVMEVSQIEKLYPYVDVFQIGARNSQNFNLLDAIGEIDKPVLLKRGMSGTIDELLYSAEYIFAKGNDKIVLCERGIRTFENSYRNTFDINAIQVLKDKSHLPVIADPSHGVGIRSHVQKLSLASLMAGADGLIIEIHPQPEEAKSDGQQTLDFEESKLLFQKITQLKPFLFQN
ncbi:MAG: 3-deoxy-7-phosphoheptulonate synthase [Bacteroidia bacterium]